MTASLRGRPRSRRKLTPDQVAELRARVGVPQDGPTPEMLRAWSDEERDASDEPPVSQPKPASAPPNPRGDKTAQRIETLERRAERLERERDKARADVDRLADLLAGHCGEVDELRAVLAATASERDNLRAGFAAASVRIADMQLDVANVLAMADRLSAATAEPDTHRHAWEWQPGLKTMPLPCACGLPWPRSRTPGGA